MLKLMETSTQPVGEVQVLGQSRVWPAIAIPAALAVVMAVVAVVFRLVFW